MAGERAKPGLVLHIGPGLLAVARLGPGEPAPAWAARGTLSAVIRTPDELTVVCADEVVPAGVRAERRFRALGVRGPLAFDAVGILVSLARPLAAAGVSILAFSTFDTDWLLVRDGDLVRAVAALERAGHRVA